MAGPESVFRRIPGDGWLVLIGAAPELGGETADLMERLLERLDLGRPIAAIAAPDSDPDEVNELLESLEEWLGVEAGLLELDTDLDAEGWDESGLLLLDGDDPEVWVEALRGAPEERLRQSLEQGCLILAIGGAASAFGSQCLSPVRPDILIPALGWIPDTVIVLEAEDAHGEVVREWMVDGARRLVLRLEPGSILALGPEDKVERWGQAAPEILLGKGWAEG
jgi:hypothetical protein